MQMANLSSCMVIFHYVTCHCRLPISVVSGETATQQSASEEQMTVPEKELTSNLGLVVIGQCQREKHLG